MSSSDFFKDNEGEEPRMGGHIVAGIANLAAVKGYIVVAAKAKNSKELALYVTTNADVWHRAEFGDSRIEEDAYTILESTNYSIQVDVKTSDQSNMGELFSSNSNGTYFSPNIQHTNRNEYGIVDFEKIQDIQGILLVNVVDNWEEVEKTWLVAKTKKSQISFDDGRTWNALKAGDDDLHVHSVTDQRQNGKIFSSAAPGLVLGVGNTGKTLDTYANGDLYASDDAGETWWFALKGPHLYEFGGAGSVIIATSDKGDAEVLQYSVDFGHTWTKVDLPMPLQIFEVTTIPDSTSLKFLLSGMHHTTKGNEFYALSVDFSGVLDKCGEKQFTDWYPRMVEDKATCIMGHRQRFQRREPNATCLVDDEFHEPLPKSEPCKCDDKADFECDYNFKREDGKCVPAGPLVPPAGACEGDEKEFKGPSGYRKIPGNNCERTDGKQPDDEIMRSCNNTSTDPVGDDDDTIDNDIVFTMHTFKSRIKQFHYLEHAIKSGDDQNPDETVIVLTEDNEVYITHDQGKTWKPVPGVEGQILRLFPHPYNNDRVYLTTPTKKVYYTKDNGKNFHYFEAPEKPPDEKDGIQTLMFHPKEPDWLIFIGGKDCDPHADANCHTVAHVSQKGGEGDWHTLLPYVRKCQFVNREGRERLVLCEQYANEDITGPLQLLSSDDFFEHKVVHFEDVVNFATMAEFIVVASRTEDRTALNVSASRDAKTFALAEFPPKFEVPHQEAYTVLESSTDAIFLHVTVNANEGQEYGSIIKSNSNGTEYVMSRRDVNRDHAGYVDFEKIASLKGLAIANIVDNTKEVEEGSKKKLKTMITHNDGADWTLLPAPSKNSEGKAYCTAGDGIDKCALHLHGYSEKQARSTYGSPSAIGLVMGVGNVGPYLSNEESETYFSDDGGVTWSFVKEGRYMWDYGDQGGIIAIVKKGTTTSGMLYSLDRGKNWRVVNFNDKAVNIRAITSVPSDMSRRFLLWGDDFTVRVDFSKLFGGECVLSKDSDDYEYFEPKHPKQDKNCLFGVRTQYYRKKVTGKGKPCYNGPGLDRFDVEEHCPCIRQDFEW